MSNDAFLAKCKSINPSVEVDRKKNLEAIQNRILREEEQSAMLRNKKIRRPAVAAALLAGILSLFVVVAYATSPFWRRVDTMIPITSQSGSEWFINISSIEEPLGVSNASYELSGEEAAIIAVNVIEQFFMPNLSGETIDMYYFTAMQGDIWRGIWSGGVTLNGSTIPTYSLLIDAETGTISSISYNPYAVYTLQGWWPTSYPNVHSPTDQDNYEYAILAMELARDLSIFNSEIAKARIVGYAGTVNPAGELSMTISVAIQCINGDVMSMGFNGSIENNPILTSIATGGFWNPSDEFSWVIF